MTSPLAKLASRFKDDLWRLNNLYMITDKNGRRVNFITNTAQETPYHQMHNQNVILKARQRGFTTFIQLLILDACVFNSDIRGGTIAHTLPDAQVIFRDKVRFPYDNLPDGIKDAVPAQNDNTTELPLANNSGIRVGVSLRSGTLQYLHISEYGKICAKFQDKAREVRPGALNAVDKNGIVCREHRGRPGRAFLRAVPERADAAQCRRRADADGLQVLPLALVRGRGLSARRRIGGYPGLVSRLFRQAGWPRHPADAGAKGLVREKGRAAARRHEAGVSLHPGRGLRSGDRGRLLQRPADADGNGQAPDPVADRHRHSSDDDLGPGAERSLHHLVRPGGRPRDPLRRLLREQRLWPGAIRAATQEASEQHGFVFGEHYFPHDVNNGETSNGKSRFDTLVGLSIAPVAVPRVQNVNDGINAVRRILGQSLIDPVRCERGLKALRNYRKDWDEDRATFRDKPFHNWASHGADSFRNFAQGYVEPTMVKPRGRYHGKSSSGGSWESA